MNPRRLIPLLCGLSGEVHAGNPAQAQADAAVPCTWFEDALGTAYTSEESPWLSRFQLTGLLQWQAAYLDGTGTTGEDFSERYTEWRRFRLGARVEFLRYFTYRGMVDLSDDNRFNGGELDLGFIEFFESNLSFDVREAFGLTAVDSLSIGYGRYKWFAGLEARTSATELLTLERSAISNKLFGPYLPTGILVKTAKGPWSATIGIHSSNEASDALGADDGNIEGWGGWNDGLMSSAGILWSVNGDLRLGLDLLYNAADEFGADEDSLLDYRWATALSAEYARGPAGVNIEGILGGNGGSEMHADPARRGSFWGFVATPYYWLVPDKLQAVVQYAYAGSEEDEGIRSNSRYLRATNYGGGGNPDLTNGGRGDELHTVYAGLNYLVCGHHLKFQAGAEYATLKTPGNGDGGVETLTWLFGFRSSF
jgi:hypothetical protein